MHTGDRSKITGRDGSAATGIPLVKDKDKKKSQVPPAYDWGLYFDGVHPKTILRLDVTAKKKPTLPAKVVVVITSKAPAASAVERRTDARWPG